MLVYFLHKLKEYLEIRISHFELFEKEKLKNRVAILNDILKNIKSDKEIETLYLTIVNNQIMILECLFKKPELQFECIIDGLTNIDKYNMIVKKSDIATKITNISDDDINLH
jgi:hypothetical protein